MRPHPGIRLDVFADIACPWCFIGRRLLADALARRDGPPVEVRHRAFQLDPRLPDEGVPFGPHIAAKLGGPEAVEASFRRLEAIGAEVGIPFAMDAITRAPNTRLAHRVVACAAGRGDADAVLGALYAGYFCDGRDVTDPAGLRGALDAAGIPDGGDLVDAAVEGHGAERVAEDLDLGRHIGVSSVPTLVADGRRGLVGAHPPESLLRFLSAATAGA